MLCFLLRKRTEYGAEPRKGARTGYGTELREGARTEYGAESRKGARTEYGAESRKKESGTLKHVPLKITLFNLSPQVLP